MYVVVASNPLLHYSIVLCVIVIQDPESFFTVCEALSYIVRSDQCITEDNFTSCLRTIR